MTPEMEDRLIQANVLPLNWRKQLRSYLKSVLSNVTRRDELEQALLNGPDPAELLGIPETFSLLVSVDLTSSPELVQLTCHIAASVDESSAQPLFSYTDRLP